MRGASCSRAPTSRWRCPAALRSTRRTRRRRCCSTRAPAPGTPRPARRFAVDEGSLAEVLPADAVLGELLPAAREALGLAAGTLVVCGCGDEMAATLGAGVVDPGVVCNVVGTAEPICAVTREPCFDPTGLVECHPHADPATWLLENPGFVSGGGYRWFRDHLGQEELARSDDVRVDVYELLNELAATGPAGLRRPGLAALPDGRDGAGVERRRARLLVRPDARARPGPPAASAARGLRLRAARRARGDARRRRGARAHRLRRRRRALRAVAPDPRRRHRRPGGRRGRRRDDGARRGDAGRRRARACTRPSPPRAPR